MSLVTKMIKINRTVALLTSQILLSIICLVHLLVTFTYLFNARLSAYTFPVSVVVALGANFLFNGWLGVSKKTTTTASAVSLSVLCCSILVAVFYFDLSWDGQWYHQAAVYNLAGEWNPIFKPMETPDGLNHSSVLHFPKDSWYFAAAATKLFGTVEVGKAYNAIALVAGSGVLYSLCRNFNLSSFRSMIITALVLLNPVVWSEITSYLNDCDIYLFLVIYLAAVILWIRDPKPSYALIVVMAICCLVNIKFTGLVFVLLSSFFIFICLLVQKRYLVGRFLLSHFIAGVLAIGVFGFNPYITNTIHRGHPLYPLIGSKAFPSVFDRGADDNEIYETPKNMQGKSLPIRMLYANFGYPGNAPYNGEDTARLANPLVTPASSWSAYHFQETRVAGFGPYFGLLLIIGVITLFVILVIWKAWRLPILIFFVAICCELSISKHFWWPRLFPMLWLVTLLPLFLFWIVQASPSNHPGNRAGIVTNIMLWAFAIFIATNGLIVDIVHLRWETVSSVNLRNELKQIRDAKQPIEVDYGWFKRATEEKLNHWNILYTPVVLGDKKARKLTSVVEGYPNQILYRLKYLSK